MRNPSYVGRIGRITYIARPNFPFYSVNPVFSPFWEISKTAGAK